MTEKHAIIYSKITDLFLIDCLLKINNYYLIIDLLYKYSITWGYCNLKSKIAIKSCQYGTKVLNIVSGDC